MAKEGDRGQSSKEDSTTQHKLGPRAPPLPSGTLELWSLPCKAGIINLPSKDRAQTRQDDAGGSIDVIPTLLNTKRGPDIAVQMVH